LRRQGNHTAFDIMTRFAPCCCAATLNAATEQQGISAGGRVSTGLESPSDQEAARQRLSRHSTMPEMIPDRLYSIC